MLCNIICLPLLLGCHGIICSPRIFHSSITLFLYLSLVSWFQNHLSTFTTHYFIITILLNIYYINLRLWPEQAPIRPQLQGSRKKERTRMCLQQKFGSSQHWHVALTAYTACSTILLFFVVMHIAQLTILSSSGNALNHLSSFLLNVSVLNPSGFFISLGKTLKPPSVLLGSYLFLLYVFFGIFQRNPANLITHDNK